MTSVHLWNDTKATIVEKFTYYFCIVNLPQHIPFMYKLARGNIQFLCKRRATIVIILIIII